MPLPATWGRRLYAAMTKRRTRAGSLFIKGPEYHAAMAGTAGTIPAEWDGTTPPSAGGGCRQLTELGVPSAVRVTQLSLL